MSLMSDIDHLNFQKFETLSYIIGTVFLHITATFRCFKLKHERS